MARTDLILCFLMGKNSFLILELVNKILRLIYIKKIKDSNKFWNMEIFSDEVVDKIIETQVTSENPNIVALILSSDFLVLFIQLIDKDKKAKVENYFKLILE